MNKLGIWAIAVAGAFLIGVVSANPVVEAVEEWNQAVELKASSDTKKNKSTSGWQAAVEILQSQIDDITEGPTQLPILTSPPAMCTSDLYGQMFLQENPPGVGHFVCVCLENDIGDIDWFDIGSNYQVSCSAP